MVKRGQLHISLLIILFLASACTAPSAGIKQIIGGEIYEFKGGVVTQLTSDKDTTVKIGVIADIHGETEKLQKAIGLLQEHQVELIVIPGDLYLNDMLRYEKPEQQSNKEELRQVLHLLGQTQVPVLIIPGNHEEKSVYETVMKEMSKLYPQLIDMTQYRTFDGDDVDFVSLPGYQIKHSGTHTFLPPDGYWATPEMIQETGMLAKHLDDAVILITHAAGRTLGNPSPSTILSGIDVGDLATTQMQLDAGIKFSLSGHIHEAGGVAVKRDGTSVAEDIYSEEMMLNAGTLEEWSYLNGKTYDATFAIVTIEGKKAKYHMIRW